MSKRPQRLAHPLFGVLARRPSARSTLSPESLYPLVDRWAAHPTAQDWWIDRSAGVAFFRPETVITGADGAQAVFAARGAITSTGRRRLDPRRWPELRAHTAFEAILSDILERDTQALTELRGQFAIACWDGRDRRLTLACDHFGQRALYVRTVDDLDLFCSELAPLLTLPGYPVEFSREGGFWYLSFGMAPPRQTLARGVARVAAAHVRRWEPGSNHVEYRYWTPLRDDAPRRADDGFIDRMRATLDQSIIERASSECAIMLSGGVDSTFMAATLVEAGISPVAVTSAFGSGEGREDVHYAGAVADWLGLEHHLAPLGADQALELLEQLVLPSAEPLAAWASLTHVPLLAKVSQQGQSMLLSGLGADEIFGGYDHFRKYYARLLDYGDEHPLQPGMHPIEELLLSDTPTARRALYPGVARFFDDQALRDGLHPPYNRWQWFGHFQEFYRECLRLKPTAEPMELMVAHECQHRIPRILFANFETLSKRMGVEVNYPFLTPEVVELACGLAVEDRYRTASGHFSRDLDQLLPGYKWAMMRVAEGRVPPEILNRRRKSYTAPFGQWLFQPHFGTAVVERIRASALWETNLVRREWLDEILAQVVPGPNPWVFQLWALLTLSGWYDHYVGRHT